MICKICNKDIKPLGFGNHLRYHHIEIKNTKEYYDTYLKKENEGVCKSCGKPTRFNNIVKGYSIYCSAKCTQKDPEYKKRVKQSLVKSYTKNREKILHKMKQTNLKKFGTDSYTKTSEYKEKTKATCLKKYGAEHYTKTKEFKDKIKETCLKKYGVKHYSQTQEYKDKFKETNLKKYGAEHYAKTQECKDKIKETNLKKYGTDNYTKTSEYKEKTKATCLKKYGVDNYAKTQECKDKVKETNLKRYGVDNYAKTKEYKNKVKETNLKKYGVNHYSKTQECKDKVKETSLKKYGVDNYGKTQECKNKVKQTCLKKYGTNNYLEVRSQETFEQTKKILKENNYEFISRENGLHDKNFNSSYILKHIKCNKQFKLSYHTIVQHYIKENKLDYLCPHCYPKNISLKELELQDFIKTHYKNNIIISDRTILKDNQELDIYIPEYNFAIEFNGMYWHSEQAGKDKNYHLNKTIQCEKQGIHLIHIFEDEWDNHKAIIKYKILNKLHLIKDRIHARKCKVIVMSSKYDRELARRFLDTHHIQGRDNSSIYYGLMYENNIVSVMSFSKSRRNIFGDRSNNNNIELVRFASHLKYNIPGAASKLFKHFERDNPNVTIISYAHRRLTNINNNLYLKLGFTLKRESAPGYYYYDGVKRYHRYNFRKSVLVEMGYDSKLTEFEITDMIGLLRIWDCGQLVFTYKKGENNVKL